jgi:hypothetical protein
VVVPSLSNPLVSAYELIHILYTGWRAGIEWETLSSHCLIKIILARDDPGCSTGTVEVSHQEEIPLISLLVFLSLLLAAMNSFQDTERHFGCAEPMVTMSENSSTPA